MHCPRTTGACREQGGWAEGSTGGGFPRRRVPRLPLHPAALGGTAEWCVRRVRPPGDWCWGGDLVIRTETRLHRLQDQYSLHMFPALPSLSCCYKISETRQRGVYFLIDVWRQNIQGERGYHCWFHSLSSYIAKGYLLALSSHGFPSVHSGKGWGGRTWWCLPFSFGTPVLLN